uniref:Chaperonin GroEL n=1 Tax=uncultured virus TaxID=340016 RepID=A0A219YK75_9VIRU|nr:chaperonin GroEL [uncultured virus]
MEYNLPSELVKDLNFGGDAKDKVITGVNKLARAVKSTLGASGKCVIYEDGRGKPVITKDGVTVAESVVLYDSVENMGATLIKEAARNTVKEAGDGTTTATVLAEALIKQIDAALAEDLTIREIKDGVNETLDSVIKYLDDTAIDVKGDMLKAVSAISCNNDKELGGIISDAYDKVGKNGVVLMEESPTADTYVDIVDGAQIDCGLTSPHFVTNTDRHVAELDNPLILTVSSEIPNVRKIQNILEHVIKSNRSLLIVAPVAQQVKSALLMNKVKGNIKVNIIDPPGFGPTKKDAIEDLAILTGATVLNEELGDDLDLMKPEHLGEAEFSITDDKNTVITLEGMTNGIENRIDELNNKLAKEKNSFIKKKLEQRLATLSGSVGIVKVGAGSKVELKEKKDRVEDAIYATKAALKEGIVPGGGIALLNAKQKISTSQAGQVLLNALSSPYETIMDNAGMMLSMAMKEGYGCNVINGKFVKMIDEGIIDPVLVTKSALKNAVSVALTVMSADCVISNIRIPDASN